MRFYELRLLSKLGTTRLIRTIFLTGNVSRAGIHALAIQKNSGKHRYFKSLESNNKNLAPKNWHELTWIVSMKG